MDLLKPSLDPARKSTKADQSNTVSVRFELSLKTTSDSDCSEFSYLELVKEHNKKNKIGSVNANKGDEEDMKMKHDAESMAKYFEQKYGAKKKRKDRMQDLADVGYGYDETDPFVDNSECYDELIPSSLTTQFGGFYINSGKLEFKQVSDDSNDDEDSLPIAQHLKKGKLLSSDEDTNDAISWKKIKKRKASLEREEKRRKLSLQGKEKLGKLAKSSKKTKVQLLVAKARKAQHHSTSDKLTASKHQAEKKVIVNGNSEKLGLSTSSNSASKKLSKQSDGYLSSSSDEVSLARLSSKDDSKTSAKEEPKLPQSIPLTIKEKINSLTKIAKTNENEGKLKFFSPDVNHLLLGIEAGSQSLSSRERSGIYQHLTPHMPCSKDTLIRRMKKLHQSKQDENLRAPLADLKRAIDEVMEEQSKRYDEECAAQQLAKLDDRAPLAASTDEDDDGVSATPGGEEKTKRTYAPRRKFQWNDKIKTLLFDVIKVKLKQLEESKSKQNTPADEYLKNFFETEVKGLWPKGWMQSRVLYKESRHVHGNVTGDMPKPKKAPPAPNRKPGKSEKKIASTPLSSLPGEVSSRPKEASMSVNLSLNSASDDLSPVKRAELMNRAILSAQKEMIQPKQGRKKQDSSEVGKNCYVKLSSALKDATQNISLPANDVTSKSNDFSKSLPKKEEFLSIDNLLKQQPTKPRQDHAKQQTADDIFQQVFSKELPLHFSTSKNSTQSVSASKDASKQLSSKDITKQFSNYKDSSQKFVSSKDLAKPFSTHKEVVALKQPTTFKDSAKHFSTSKDLSQQQPFSSSKDTSKQLASFKDPSKPYSTFKDSSKQFSSKDPVKQFTAPKDPAKSLSTSKASKHASLSQDSSKRFAASKQLDRNSLGMSDKSASASNSMLTTSSLDSFGAELLKLALMAPPGSAMLSSMVGSSESLSQPTLDDLANFIKLQQVTLEKQRRVTPDVSPHRNSKSHRVPEASSQPIPKQRRSNDTSPQQSAKQVRSADESPQRSSSDVFFPYGQSASHQTYSKQALNDVKLEKLKASGARKDEVKHNENDTKKHVFQSDLIRARTEHSMKVHHQTEMQKRSSQAHADTQAQPQACIGPQMRHHHQSETHQLSQLTPESLVRPAATAPKRTTYQSSDFATPKRPPHQQNDHNRSPYSKEQVISSYLQNPSGNTVNSSSQANQHPKSTSNHFNPVSKAAPRSASSAQEQFRIADLALSSDNSDHFSIYSGSYPSSFVASDNLSTQMFTPPSSIYLPQDQRKSTYQSSSDSARFTHANMSSASQLDDAAMEALLSVHQQLRPGARR